MQHETCNFEIEIFDPKIRGTRKITCDENALKSKKCKFHDKEYLNKNPHTDISDEIYKKIEEACKNNTVLECVGYNIPEINLEGKKFQNAVFFSHANFVGNVIFDHSEFESFVDFSNCSFENEVNFSNVFFDNKVDFSTSQFNNHTYFEASKFRKKADFSSSEFNETSFLATEFDEVDFSNVEFYKGVSFGTAEFKEKTFFTDTIFDEEAKFYGVKFSGEISFSRTIFNKYAHFRKSLFVKPDLTIFDSDLSHVSFLGTDISRIKFGNQVKWNIDSIPTNRFDRFLNKIKKPNNKFIIYDEWLLENNQEPSLQLEDIMDIYRNLRENHDFYLKYEIAGEFFVREMELKRKYRKNKTSSSKETIPKKWYEKFSIYGIYNIISQYGHSIYRPVYISIPILSIFTFLFCIENSSNKEFADSTFQEIFLDAIFRTITSFFPFYSIGKDVNYLDIILRLILLPLSGSFFIALKRKLERKFRH